MLKSNKGKSLKCTNRAFISGYTPLQFTIQELHNVLKSQYPYIKKVTMPYKSKIWQGYGFVDFKDKDDFLKFLKLKRIRVQEFEMNLVIKPQKLGRALKNFIKDFKKRRVLVKGIPNWWDDFKLEEYFAQFGKLENAYVIRNGDQESSFTEGMVAFLAKKDAVKCYEHERICLGDGLWLQVEHFQGKENHLHHQSRIESGNVGKGKIKVTKKSSGNSAPKSPKRETLSKTIHCYIPTEKRYHYFLQKMEHPHHQIEQSGNLRLNRESNRCSFNHYRLF